MDKYMKHICKVIDIGTSSTRKLKDAKIVSIDALISSKRDMHKERFAGLRKSKRSDILKVIKLLEHWRRLGGADQYILQVENFSEEEFMRILEQDMDKYMKHICEVLDFGTRSRRTLKDAKIVSIDDLVSSKQRMLEEGFVDLREDNRASLLKVITSLEIWRREGKTDEHILTICSEEEFEKVMDMDKYVKRICKVIEFGDSSTAKLRNENIVSIDALLSSKQSMHKQKFAGLRDNKRSDILKVIKLMEIWRREGKTDDEILNDFTEDEFDKISSAVDEEARKKAEEEKRNLRDKIRGEIIVEENKRKEYIDLLRKPCDGRHSILRPQDESSRNDFIQKCMKDIMTKKLRDSCSIYNELLTKSLRTFDELAGNPASSEPKKFVIAGRTQSGKSSVKGVVQSMCGLLKIPLIVLTKGVDESIDLHQKLLSFSEGTKMPKEHILVASSRRDGHGVKAKRHLIDLAFGSERGGTLVIADTEAQVLKKACEAIRQYRVKVPNGRFVVIVDEADAMYRTPAKEQKFEKSLQTLLDMGAALEIYISASPMPLILELMYGDKNSSGNNIDLLNLEPNEEYIGLEDIKPLTVNGVEVYLKQNELAKNSVEEGIPYANENVLHLYDDALSNLENQKGVLVLDCSCPRMYVQCNITDKANAVQKYYGNQSKDIVVITFKGNGISVRFPSKKWDTDTWKKKTISEVLEHIDVKYGLKMPVFIFGFIKMCRGISFRSAKRVPTHMVVSLGRGHNSSTVLQTIGRATFNGRSILTENGFETVKVLTTQSDFYTSREKQKFINEVHRRMNEEGNTLAVAFAGSNEKFPHALNFAQHTFREIGRIKGHRELFQERINFEEAPMELSSQEKNMKERIWYDFNGQAVLRSIARLSRGNNHNFDRDDIIHDIMEVEENILKKKQVNEVLRSFCDNVIIHKDQINSTKHGLAYKVHSPKRLKLFMNEEMGEIPESDDEEETSDILEEESSQGDSNSETDSSLSINEVEEDSASQRSIHMVSPGRSLHAPNKRSNSYEDNIRAVSQNTTMNVSPLGSDLSTPDSDNHSDNEDEGMHIVTQDTRLTGSIGVPRIKDSVDLHSVSSFSSYGDSSNNSERKKKRKNTRELRDTVSSVRRKSRRTTETNSSKKYSATDITDVPKGDHSKTGTTHVQKEKDRVIYFAKDNETLLNISEKFGIPVGQILHDNKRRKRIFRNIDEFDELEENSPIVLPIFKVACKAEP